MLLREERTEGERCQAESLVECSAEEAAHG
jgi:hypothetical protein